MSLVFLLKIKVWNQKPKFFLQKTRKISKLKTQLEQKETIKITADVDEIKNRKLVKSKTSL